jgi:zinc transporter ZupT
VSLPLVHSAVAGAIASIADIFGGLLLVRAHWDKRSIRYFVALGAGFMMATAVLEMLPESLRLNGAVLAPVLILSGYCAMHLLEHTISAHFHYGEETHSGHFMAAYKGYSVLGGLAVHCLFDGVAIASGFVLSSWLGWLIFLAIFLHKIPEGFTVASVMLASGRSRRTALASAVVLASSTMVGVLGISLEPNLVRFGLPLAAGVAIYVAATDLVPEVNREPGIRMALVFFAGVALFALLRLLAPEL